MILDGKYLGDTGRAGYTKMKLNKGGKRRPDARSGTAVTYKNQGVDPIDNYGRMKRGFFPMDVYKNKTATRASSNTAATPIWNTQRVNNEYSGSRAFDLERRRAKEKSLEKVFRSKTPLPWNPTGKITLRDWQPPPTE